MAAVPVALSRVGYGVVQVLGSCASGSRYDDKGFSILLLTPCPSAGSRTRRQPESSSHEFVAVEANVQHSVLAVKRGRGCSCCLVS
jgi:hypothetical protein